MSYLSALSLCAMLRRSLKYTARPRPRQRVANSVSVNPLVSVVIPTYNWSSVLRLAIGSALWQSEQDFEVLVIGDACSDDSGHVVDSFGDARLSFHNLETNSGSQSAPNNAGVARARGRYVAYLGHDDIWHPEHLRTMLAAAQASHADVASSLVEMIGPRETNFRVVTGIYPDDGYDGVNGLPPSGLMHRRELAERIGGWRDYRTLWRNPDTDFVYRLWESGCRFASTRELTVFKFNSSLRKNSYVEKPCHEQKRYRERIARNRFFLLGETLAIANVHLRKLPMTVPHHEPPPAPDTPGWEVSQYRKFRGLE